MAKTISSLDIFRYYRIDVVAAGSLRTFLSQILETYLDEGSTPMVISLTKTEFEAMSQAYHDLLVGYKHPRVDSMCWRWRCQDRTLRKLKSTFPSWQTVDEIYKQ